MCRVVMHDLTINVVTHENFKLTICNSTQCPFNILSAMTIQTCSYIALSVVTVFGK